MRLRKFLAILTVALVVVLAVLVWFFPSNGDFRSDNPSWNGLEDMSTAYTAMPLKSLSDLPLLSQGSTLILVPYLDFTPAELEGLHRFVTRGGTLVLADDYGFGNHVLEYLGLKARFSGGVLLDPLFCYKNKWFPRIFHFESSPITSDVESLVLNHATCLTSVETSDALALSSSSSFLDLNGNEEQDEGEPAGPLPVIARCDLGSGQIILISDPSIFINSMENMGSNHEFIQNITSTASSGLLVDQSHLPSSNLQQSKSLLASLRKSFSSPVGAVTVVILTLAVTLLPVWRGKETATGSKILGERRGH